MINKENLIAYIYIYILFELIMAHKRKRKNSQRGMHKKMITGKKPMSDEAKLAQKKNKEKIKELNKKKLVKK